MSLKILFGVSGTEECRKAVPSIIKLFGSKDGVMLSLVHVVQETIIVAESGMVDYASLEQSQEEEAQAIFSEFVSLFKEAGFECQALLRRGNPLDVILEMAPNFDLLVIGSSESSLLYRIFYSYQNSFVNASPIPVLVAK